MKSDFVQERENILRQYQKLILADYSEIQDYIIQLFTFQYKYNKTYQIFCDYLGITNTNISSTEEIPFLPISAYKHHTIKTGEFNPQIIFTSSGTTGVSTSRHYISDVQHYLQNTVQIWNSHFSPTNQNCFLALLPSYLERTGSSLVSMVEHFITLSDFKESGFYIHDYDRLYQQLLSCEKQNIPVVIIGVTYAVLDFSTTYPCHMPHLSVIETGGMKGLRNEMTKAELHSILKSNFGTDKILSEYGMTELLSQAYTNEQGRFCQNTFLKIKTAQINDPLTSEKKGKTGIICCTDLANIDSCAFIQTEDIGIMYEDETFTIAGRLTAADARGCNLLLADIGWNTI